MAPISSLRRDQYKLKTTFDSENTIHTIVLEGGSKSTRETQVCLKWRHKKDIGAGGFGTVWLEEEEDGQLRAVKRLPQYVRNADWSRELEILAQLKNHQTLFVQFLGWYEDEDKGFAYFAMEYIQHGDLSQYLEVFQTEVMAQAKDIVTQLLRGLDTLHKYNICHRDIKPKNILVASPSPIWVKIADFGLSKHLDDTALRTDCGTSGYIAPELQGLVKKVNGTYTNLVDVWSLGIVTHEILTLEIPFLSDDVPEPDSDSGFCVSSDPEQRLGTPAMDMHLFYDYCLNLRSFPVRPLRRCKVSNEGIEFVRMLLVADPRLRITPAKALQSPWLLNKSQEPYNSGPGEWILINHKKEQGVRGGALEEEPERIKGIEIDKQIEALEERIRALKMYLTNDSEKKDDGTLIEADQAGETLKEEMGMVMRKQTEQLYSKYTHNIPP